MERFSPFARGGPQDEEEAPQAPFAEGTSNEQHKADREILRGAFKAAIAPDDLDGIPELQDMLAIAQQGGVMMPPDEIAKRFDVTVKKLQDFRKSEGRNPVDEEWVKGSRKAKPVFG